MNRIRVPPGTIASDRVTLPADAGHKVRNVLRMTVGDELVVFDGEGIEARGVVVDAGDPVVVQIVEQRAGVRSAPISIAQALIKGEKMEWVIQKATELGASSVIPFTSERTVVKLEGHRAEERVERWQRIAEEAARQCGRADVPRVGPVRSLSELLGDPGTKVLLYEGETQARLGQFLRSSGDHPFELMVGPEGGFDASEVADARAAGAQVMGLGPRILRTETVALAALAMALYQRGDLG